MLKRYAKDPVSDVTSIDELKDFFGDEGDGGSGEGTDELNPFGKVIIRAKPVKQKAPSSITGEGAEGGDDGGTGGGGGAGGSGGGDKGGRGGTGPGEGGRGGGTSKPLVPLHNVRAIQHKINQRKISFTPSSTGTVSIKLQEAGADTDFDISITKTDNGKLNNGQIIMDVVKSKRIIISVNLEHNFTGALKVLAHEI